LPEDTVPAAADETGMKDNGVKTTGRRIIVPGPMQKLGVNEHGFSCFEAEPVCADQADDRTGQKVEQFKLVVPVPGDSVNRDIVVISRGRKGPGGVDAFFFSVCIDRYVLSKKGHGCSFPYRSDHLSRHLNYPGSIRMVYSVIIK
jgi:hypothetical protein